MLVEFQFKIPHLGPLFFSGFREFRRKTVGRPLRSVSSPFPISAAPNLPVSWCNLQLSIKISLWIAVFHFWVSLDLHKWPDKDELSQMFEMIHADLKEWPGWPVSSTAIVFECLFIRSWKANLCQFASLRQYYWNFIILKNLGSLILMSWKPLMLWDWDPKLQPRTYRMTK